MMRYMSLNEINEMRLCSLSTKIDNVIYYHAIISRCPFIQFCSPVPELKVCEEMTTAYTSVMVYSKETDEVIEKSDHISCICPEGHNHVLVRTKFDSPNEDTEEMELIYICAPVIKSLVDSHLFLFFLS